MGGPGEWVVKGWLQGMTERRFLGVCIRRAFAGRLRSAVPVLSFAVRLRFISSIFPLLLPGLIAPAVAAGENGFFRSPVCVGSAP